MNQEEQIAAINLLFEIGREIHETNDHDKIAIFDMAIGQLMDQKGTKIDTSVDTMIKSILTMEGKETSVVNEKSLAVSLSQQTQFPLPRILEMTKEGRNKWFSVFFRRQNNLYQ